MLYLEFLNAFSSQFTKNSMGKNKNTPKAKTAAHSNQNESFDWGNPESLKKWAEGPECRQTDLSMLNYNLNDLDIKNPAERVKAFNYLETGMRVRQLMHTFKDEANISELEKYNEGAKHKKDLHLFKKASVSQLFGSDLPENPCPACDSVQQKFRDLVSSTSKEYKKGSEKNESFIKVSNNAVAEDLVECRMNHAVIKYQEQFGRQMPARLFSTVEGIHKKVVKKYATLPNWYGGNPSNSTSTAEAVAVSSVAVAHNLSSYTGRNIRFGSITMSPPEFQIARKPIESQLIFGVAPDRPEPPNLPPSRSNESLGIFFLIGAFVIGSFYHLKKKTN